MEYILAIWELAKLIGIHWLAGILSLLIGYLFLYGVEWITAPIFRLINKIKGTDTH